MAYVESPLGDNLTLEHAVEKILSDRRRDSILAFVLGLLALAAFYTSICLAYGDVPAPRQPANSSPRVGTSPAELSIQQAAVPAIAPWRNDAIEWYGPGQNARTEI